jgi:hypothetical protein
MSWHRSQVLFDCSAEALQIVAREEGLGLCCYVALLLHEYHDISVGWIIALASKEEDDITAERAFYFHHASPPSGRHMLPLAADGCRDFLGCKAMPKKKNAQ